MKNSKLRLTTAITVAFALLVGGGASLGAYAASGVSAPDASPSADATAEASADQANTVAGTPVPEKSPSHTPAAATTPSGSPAPDSSGAPREARAPLADAQVQVDAPSNAVVVPAVAPTANPPRNGAVFRISVGGTRQATGAIKAHQGVKLKLVTNQSSNSPSPSDTLLGTWATCVSDADGDCNIYVPAGVTIGGSGAPWLVVDSTPSTMFTVPKLNAGDASSLTSTVNGFRIPTDDFRSGRTLAYPAAASTAGSRTNSGYVQSSLQNPQLAAQCSLNVGLLVDLSYSLANSQNALREAAVGFVDALKGTPARLGIWTFGDESPAVGSANTNLPLTSLATESSAAVVRSKAEGLTVPTSLSSRQGTNWDAGLRAVASSTTNVDLLLVLTDGAPTYSGVGNGIVGTGNTTVFRDIEQATFSANRLKSNNTRILALGIGGAFSASQPENLQVISGLTADTDFFPVANYTALKEKLRDIAGAQCNGTVNVTKQVTTVSGEAGLASQGWEMKVDSALANRVEPAVATTGNTGAATFKVSDLGANGTRAITIKETQQTGYELQKQGAFNAVCTRADTGANVAVSNAEPNGFTVSAIANTSVNCTIINYQIQQASVKVTKSWKVNGTTFDNGLQPFGSATYVIDGGTPSDNFGTVRAGFRAGQNISLTEPAPTGTPSGCTYQGVTGDGPKTLVAGLNIFQLVNSYTCVTSLTLNKKVVGGTAAPGDFTLIATPGGSVKSGNTVNVAPGKIVLSESGGPVQYRAAVKPGVTLVPNAVGSWECVDSTTGTAVAITDRDNGANGQVEVRYGNKISCTVTNEAAQLILEKTVIQGIGDTAQPSDWTLAAAPAAQTGTPTLPNVSVAGKDRNQGSATVIASNRAYTLSEASTTRNGTHLRLSLICTDGATSFTPENNTVTVAAGKTLRCVFTNAAKPKLSIQKIGWDPVAVTKDIGPKPTTRVDTSQPSPSDRIVQWTYLVTNSGALAVDGITVVDNRLVIDAVTCPTANLRDGKYFLEAKQSMTCWASGRLTP